MVCANCQSQSRHVVVGTDGVESCHNCGGFSEAGGKSTTGVLTRNSFRIRRQQDKALGDFTQPHTYDKSRRKAIINPDFVKQYPDKVGQYFSDSEMTKEGYKTLPQHTKKVKAKEAATKRKAQQDVSHSGSVKKGIKRILA